MLMYADDVVVYYSNSDLSRVIRVLNRTLKFLAKELLNLNLHISPRKTQFCIFSKRNALEINNYLVRNGLRLVLDSGNGAPDTIHLRTNAKFLGVIFDCRLNWDLHGKYVRKKFFQKLTF